MTPGADVSSIPVLQDWHASLCTYRTEAVESLSAIAMAIQHSHDWLDEKLNFWQREKRDADLAVVKAKAELSNRKLVEPGGRVPDCSVQEEELRHAEARYDHADEQIHVVRRWMVNLPRMINEAYEGSARRFLNFLEGELPQGLALLEGRLRSLEAYVNMKAPATAPSPAPEKPAK